MLTWLGFTGKMSQLHGEVCHGCECQRGLWEPWVQSDHGLFILEEDDFVDALKFSTSFR